ncbi:alpha/beta fold hydrolase [Microbacterium invictum]|uniref:alpha/beta fold hydrolase n=1 Tax=Microbacterium invictum TaxID=515415 RepID=UPI0024108865|nr:MULTISPECIES: alpha/beta hydrolase [Microbacterium]
MTTYLPARQPRATLALLPSHGTTTRMWGSVVQLIPPRLGAEMLLFDLPGHGGAPALAEVDIGSLATEIAQQIESTRCTGRVVIAGASTGGAIALEAAVRPELMITGVALFNSALLFGSPEGWAAIVAAATRHGTPAFDPAGTRRGWFTVVFAEGAGADVVADTLHDLADVDLSSHLACCRALAEYDGRHLARPVTTRGLAVGGTADRAVSASNMRAFAADSSTFRYEELPGAHLSVIENASGAADLLSALLRDSVARHHATAKETT